MCWERENVSDLEQHKGHLHYRLQLSGCVCVGGGGGGKVHTTN